MSIRAWLVRRRIRAVFRPKKNAGLPVEERMRHFAAALKKMESTLLPAPKDTHIEAVDEAGAKGARVKGARVKGEWVSAPGVREDRILLYCHGGGYVWGGPRQYREFGARMSKACGAKVFLLDYRLAPEHIYPAAFEDALTAYDWVRANNPDASVVMAGDSAGGNLTLAAVHAIRDSERENPSAFCLISPWLDMTGTSDSLIRNNKTEVMLDPQGIAAAGQVFRGDMAADDPRCSPLFGNQQGLPPVLVQASGAEIFLDESSHFADKVKAAGGTAELAVWPKMHHVWHFSAALVPEGKKAIKQMADFFSQHWGN